MYNVDERDRVVELTDIPSSDVGSPTAVVFASDFDLGLAYYLGGGSYDDPEKSAVVSFKGACSHMFGMPNDEALDGHPLYSRGLRSHAAFEVISSPWVRQLERINSVHDGHDPRWFDDDRHFVVTLKENMFECVAEGYEVREFEASPAVAVQHFLRTSGHLA